MLALAGTWLGLLGRIHWALDLFSHFRWQYLLICVVGVAWSLALKRPRWIQALCLASLFVNAAALYLAKGDAAYAAIAGERLRVVSLNVFAGNPKKVSRCSTICAPPTPTCSSSWKSMPSGRAALAELTATHPHHLLWPQEDNFGLAFFSRVPLQSLEVIRTSRSRDPLYSPRD